MKIVIENGKIILPYRLIDKGFIVIKDGKIHKIGEGEFTCTNCRDVQKIDATGSYISPGFIDQHIYPKWIITDMRFPNEMEAVKERKGITIRVVRDYVLRGGPEDPKNIHPSETSLDEAEFDYEIINDGTIEELVEKVITILTLEKII